MVETIEQFRALFPEISDEEVNARLAAKAEEEAQVKAMAVAESDRTLQSLRDQLAAAEQRHNELTA